MGPLPRLLVAAGVALVVAGLLLHFAPGIPLGRLPGDIRIERPGFRFHFPLASCLLVSLLLSLVLWVVSRFR